jgi:predicted transcriptional regulator
MSSVLTVRVADEVKDQMDALAEATGRSRSWVAAEAIRQYVDTEGWQIEEIRKAVVEADAGDFASDTEMEQVFNKWNPEGGANAG